jgi:hypothetical protein
LGPTSASTSVSSRFLHRCASCQSCPAHCGHACGVRANSRTPSKRAQFSRDRPRGRAAASSRRARPSARHSGTCLATIHDMNPSRQSLASVGFSGAPGDDRAPHVVFWMLSAILTSCCWPRALPACHSASSFFHGASHQHDWSILLLSLQLVTSAAVTSWSDFPSKMDIFAVYMPPILWFAFGN